MPTSKTTYDTLQRAMRDVRTYLAQAERASNPQSNLADPKEWEFVKAAQMFFAEVETSIENAKQQSMVWNNWSQR